MITQHRYMNDRHFFNDSRISFSIIVTNVALNWLKCKMPSLIKHPSNQVSQKINTKLGVSYVSDQSYSI